MIDDDDNDDVLYLNETPLSERERDWEDAPCPTMIMINFKSLKKVVLTFSQVYIMRGSLRAIYAVYLI